MQKTLKTFIVANSILKVLSIISMVFVIPLYMKYLGAADYGVYTYTTSLIVMLAFLGSFGFVEYIKAYGCTEKHATHRVSIIYSGCVTMCVLLLCIVAIFGGLVWAGVIPINIPNILIILVVVGAFTNPFAMLGEDLLLGFSYMKIYYNVQICKNILQMGGWVVLVILKLPLWMFVFWFVILSFVSACVHFFILYHKKIFQCVAFDVQGVQKSLPIAIAFAINMGSLTAMQFVDKYFMMYILGTQSVGIYGASVFIMYGILNFLYSPVERYLEGFKKTAIRQNNIQQAEKIVNFNIYYIFIVYGAVVLSYSIYGQPFLKWYLGMEFVDAHKIALLLSLGMLQSLVIWVFYKMVILQHKTANTYQMYINVGALVLNIIFNALWIPVYGIKGAVYAMLVSIAFTTVTSLIIMYVKYQYKIFYGNICAYVLILSVVYMMGYVLWDNSYGLIGCFIFSGISVLVCVVLSWVVSEPRQYMKFLLKTDTYL